MFQSQQGSGARGAPLGSNRLQNGKLAGSSQWAFGGPMGGAPGLSAAQPRANGGGLSSFAQTIGGSQPQTPINLEEFPSLSGAPQAQQNTSAQQMWSNPTLRTTQHSTIQRPQGQNPPGQPGQPVQGQPHEDGSSSAQSQFSGGGDEYRFGGQSGVGQLSGGGQPQTGNIEEFPPLGGAGGEMGPDRRTGMIQSAASFGGNANTTAFPGLGQTRNGLSSPTDAQQDRSLNSAMGDRTLQAVGVSRTPFENIRSNTDTNQRTGQGLGNPSFSGGQLPLRVTSGNSVAPIGQRPQQSQFDPIFGAENVGSPNAQHSQHKKLADMTESERYGLPGLLSMIPIDSPDYSSLAVGQDLTVLGLDLSRPDNSPLHPTFGSPFVEANVKPVVPSDFTLPAAYTVTNVPPLHSKMNSFTAETLLAIFYQHPKDILQEIAAQELYQRDWRWHIKLQQWMMKDPDLPNPIRISPKVERGWYLFFDVNNWRRERVSGRILLTGNNADREAERMSDQPKPEPMSQEVRNILVILMSVVRQMTFSGTVPIPSSLVRFNLLASPMRMSRCFVCNYPGHNASHIDKPIGCRAAIMSTIGFWEDVVAHITKLSQLHGRFAEALEEQVVTYQMRLEEAPHIAGNIEQVIVSHLTRNYLKFQSHYSSIRPKAYRILDSRDLERYDEITKQLNTYLLQGATYDDLFERSIADQM
ncbi:hypothetical protein EJ04DRAFT_436846 [Polyplosphaeria fusca]|uniref:NOT2/NOT3/NOT5 C-terminal domain-containing protein n=1 Tax=Polyplosphaeria fusca TaxID=682080 RepID=A0A9P4V2S0_9PLEO|nr:hypothetical protein EJ04DRAFT_436846 [Polyplosphaeria fusca]